MTVDQATFRSVLGRFASGVTVVTAQDGTGMDRGMTASAFCSLSLDPPLVLFCVEKTAELHATLQEATRVVVNTLSEDQESLSRRFSEPMSNRFEGVGFTRGLTGAVVLDGVLAYLECELKDQHPGGDHSIFVARVIAAHVSGDRPLLYYRGGYTGLER